MASPARSDRLVLLHGLAGYGGEWQALSAHLNPELAIVTPDLPGHGDSEQSQDMSAENFVRFTADLIRESGNGEPVVLVGQSMGGIVATLVAARHPELVRGLVLVECGMEAASSEDIGRVDSWLAGWPLPFIDMAAATEFFGGGPLGEAWAEGLDDTDEGLRPKFDRSSIVSALQNLGGQDRWREWSKVACPVLVCVAGKSVLSEVDLSRVSELSPRVLVERFEDSGHDIHLEQAKQLAGAILSFLGTLE